MPEVIPVLIDLLKTKPALCELLTKVLKTIGMERPKEVGEAVVPLLRHQDPSIAEAAEDVFSTTTITEASNDDAIPDLLRRYDSREEGEAEAGVALRLRATTNSAEVVDGILERIKAHEESGRTSAWLALLYLIAERRVRRAVAALTDLMLHGVVSVRCGALKAVGESSNPAGNRKVIAAVQASTKDADATVRCCATLAAGHSSEKFAAELVPDLIAAVDDPDPWVCFQALQSLIKLRDHAPAADDAIWARFSSEDDLMAFVESALQRRKGSSPS